MINCLSVVMTNSFLMLLNANFCLEWEDLVGEKVRCRSLSFGPCNRDIAAGHLVFRGGWLFFMVNHITSESSWSNKAVYYSHK